MERIGHRGAKREFPENTLVAFERAFERGADAIELDVHVTRDGVVVVHHDPTLPLSVSRLLRREIAELDWVAVGTVDLGGGATIPRLSDVLDAAPASATVYVEIKGTRIEEAVARVLAGRTRCAVHSFDHAAIGRMQTLAPDVPRGILFEHATPDVVAAMTAVGARDVWPDWRLIAERLVRIGVDGLCTDDVRLLDGL